MNGGEIMSTGTVEIKDVDGMIDSGNKLIEYSEEYISVVNSLYSATENLRQNYWQGRWSTEHLDKVESYKSSLIDLANKLEGLGKAVEKIGNRYSELG